MGAPGEADRLTGAMPPPPGQTANFVNPPDHNANWIALNVIMLALITTFVSIRLGTRWLVVHSLGLDDLFIALTWASSVAFSGIMLKTLDYGFGRNLWDVPTIDLLPLGEWLFISEVAARGVWGFLKNSFFFAYLRVFNPSRVMSWLCYIGVFVCSAFYVAEIFQTIFICIPVQKNWDNKLPGHCVNNGVGGSVTGIFNVISDVYILLLPLPFVARLQMKLQPKLRLLCLFGLGAAVNAISITRLVLTYTTAGDPNITIRVYKLSILILLEIDVGLLVTCAMVFPAFWDRVLNPQLSKIRSISMSRSTKMSHTSNSDTVVGPGDPEYGMALMQTDGKQQSMVTLASSHRGAEHADFSHEPIPHPDYYDMNSRNVVVTRSLDVQSQRAKG